MGERIQILVTGCVFFAALMLFVFAVANSSYMINNQLNLKANSYNYSKDIDFFKQIV
jgi:hypothetical protein